MDFKRRDFLSATAAAVTLSAALPAKLANAGESTAQAPTAPRGLSARSRAEPALTVAVKMRSCGLFDSVVENSACSLFRLLRAIQALV